MAGLAMAFSTALDLQRSAQVHAAKKASPVAALVAAPEEVRCVLHHRGKQLCTAAPPRDIAWQPLARVQDHLGLRLEEDGTRGDGNAVRAVVLVAQVPTVAVDVSVLDAAAVIAACGGEFVGTRSLMVEATAEAVAVAGRANALLTWHANHAFCGACGAETRSTEGGAKRVCVACAKRAYPRVDPVVIGLVHRTDTDSCLLGRSSKYRNGMYTCLSGFVEPCERAQDALRREVFEEAGVTVSEHVRIVDSQPWPVGRGGSCELMIACIAEAAECTIVVDTAEMEDVRWFTRAEAQGLFEASLAFSDAATPVPDGTLYCPGPYAIAHHLIRRWLDGDY